LRCGTCEADTLPSAPRRQAELGVGDCGGLRYIPGLTESGKQKTPQVFGRGCHAGAQYSGSPAVRGTAAPGVTRAPAQP
jgi:hypothetical protein